MRYCPICDRAPRAHDPMRAVQVLRGDVLSILGWPEGGYEVCHDCAMLAYPDLAPLAVPIPRGDVDPARQPEALYWCPCCRNYARHDDPIAQHATMRILPEDLDAHPELTPRPRPGAVRMCRECWALWGPVVQSRWERDGIIPHGLPLAALGLNMV